MCLPQWLVYGSCSHMNMGRLSFCGSCKVSMFSDVWVLHLFTLLCSWIVGMCVCMHTYVHLHTCACECGNQRLALNISLDHSLPYVLRESLPPPRHLITGQWALENHLSCFTLSMCCLTETLSVREGLLVVLTWPILPFISAVTFSFPSWTREARPIHKPPSVSSPSITVPANLPWPTHVSVFLC